ncbi:MAG: sigma-70 family RNA polymerase sigma factor [Acidobacteriota bacterium]
MADRGDADVEEAGWIGRVVALDDHDAFAALVSRHQASVRGFLRRLTSGDASRADDLAQETFWKAYRHLGSFKGRGRFLSWLFRIAYQEFVTDERRRHGTPVPLTDDMSSGEDVGGRVEDARTFDQLIDALRPEERSAIVLHYRHELTHAEIAEVLEAPLGTVKTLIRRGRARLARAAGAPPLGDEA